MSLLVIYPGQHAAVQDLGRHDTAAFGLSPCGAADTLSLRIGNRLVGNPDHAAAIEMTLVGGLFEAQDDLTFALTGAPASSVITQTNGILSQVHPWRAYSLRKGERLRIAAAINGARMYLCIAGGIAVPPQLGSRATHAPSAIGGLDGRTLRPGDRLPLGTVIAAPSATSLDADLITLVNRILRPSSLPCTPSPLDVGPAAKSLETARFRVSPRWDRVGIRLEGDPLPPSGNGHAMTEGGVFGFVQLPADGHPIILGPDAPPTGGYPVVAAVIAAALPAIGQLRTADPVQFSPVDLGGARLALRHQTSAIDLAIAPIDDADSPSIDLNSDVGEDPERVAAGHDDLLAAEVTSLNIACGGHAGDDATMTHLVRTAIRLGRAIGAHPGFPDRANFGRVDMEIPDAELDRSLISQLQRLRRIAESHRTTVGYVKCHGALYHTASRRPAVAEVVAHAVRTLGDHIPIVAQAGSPALHAWRDMGLTVISEAFADRAYRPDGGLVDRSQPGAILSRPEAAAAQVRMIAREGRVMAADGISHRLRADTLCVHSDSPGAIEIARAVRLELERAGFALRPPTKSITRSAGA